MDPHLWREFALNVVLHSLAGGLTDSVAVWMLFHPHTPFLGIQGAIPKNKARLARSIGTVVGEKLLTTEDLVAELSRGGVRDAVTAMIATTVQDALETERGPLRTLVPDRMGDELQRALDALAATVSERAHAWAASEAGERAALTVVQRVRGALGDRTLAELLPTERREALVAQAREWAQAFAHSATVERAVRDGVRAQVASLLERDQPLVQALPPSATAMLDRAVEAYLPIAVDRLGGFLAHPDNRERVKRTIEGVVGRFVEDLRFHERLLARFLVTERAVEKALDAVGREGVDELATLLREPEIRDEVAKAVRGGVEALLRRPLRDIVGGMDDERASQVSALLAERTVALLRAEATQDFLAQRLSALLDGWAHRELGPLLADVDDATVAGWLAQAMRSDATRDVLRDTASRLAQRALDAPIGRPARWLPADTAARLADALAPLLWGRLTEALPPLVRRLDVPALIERKVNEFSTARVEEIIRGVTQRELNLIIRFGFGLGAVIGVFTFFISQAIRAIP